MFREGSAEKLALMLRCESIWPKAWGRVAFLAAQTVNAKMRMEMGIASLKIQRWLVCLVELERYETARSSMTLSFFPAKGDHWLSKVMMTLFNFKRLIWLLATRAEALHRRSSEAVQEMRA